MVPNITFGSKTISAYMLCTIFGIFASGLFTLKKAEKTNQNELLTVLLWSAPGVIIGGHLLYAITNLPKIFNSISKGCNFISLIQYFGGNVFYGGLIGGLASAILYCKFKKIHYAEYADCAALFIPFFHVFGRVGCFLSGCCYGIECSVGFTYRYSIIESANHVSRFPIQLIEAAGNMIIFFVLNCIFEKKMYKKRLLFLYFIFYSILRFITEFFRGDFYRGFLFALSTSQVISIFLFTTSVIYLLITHRYNSKNNI